VATVSTQLSGTEQDLLLVPGKRSFGWGEISGQYFLNSRLIKVDLWWIILLVVPVIFFFLFFGGYIRFSARIRQQWLCLSRLAWCWKD